MAVPPLASPPDEDGIEALRGAPSRMPVSADSLVPWLAGGACSAAVVMFALSDGRRLSTIEWMVVGLGLAALLSATVGVALRSRARLAAADRDERTRPALDELLAGASTGRSTDGPMSPGSPPYVVGMARWAAAFAELLDHASSAAAAGDDPGTAEELVAAREDTVALRDLLEASRGATVGVNETASLHAICTLWEANQARYEALASAADSRWYRRWRARTVVERRLRHGAAQGDTLVLPYSA